MAGNTGTGATVSKADANKIISRVLNAAGGRIPGVTFNLVDTTANLPADVIADMGGTLTRNIGGCQYHLQMPKSQHLLRSVTQCVPHGERVDFRKKNWHWAAV